MKTLLPSTKWHFLLAALFLWAQGPVFLFAQGAKTNATSHIKFRPSATGIASVRVTGGSRGSGVNSVALDVLAPDGVGLTTESQPSLFWYQSKPSQARLEVTLLQDKQAKPVVQFDMEHASKAGIQRLKLSEHGARLAVGVKYQWVVALVLDPNNRSKDLVASGVIERVERSNNLKQEVAKAAPVKLANVYAEAGIWYDALAALSDQINAHPDDQALRQTRAELLRQVGLNNVASAEVASK